MDWTRNSYAVMSYRTPNKNFGYQHCACIRNFNYSIVPSFLWSGLKFVQNLLQKRFFFFTKNDAIDKRHFHENKENDDKRILHHSHFGNDNFMHVHVRILQNETVNYKIDWMTQIITSVALITSVFGLECFISEMWGRGIRGKYHSKMLQCT